MLLFLNENSGSDLTKTLPTVFWSLDIVFLKLTPSNSKVRGVIIEPIYYTGIGYIG